MTRKIKHRKGKTMRKTKVRRHRTRKVMRGGGHKHKRSGHGYKRSGHGHKHKRSGHKRSGHKRSGHKRHHVHSQYMMHGGGAPSPWVGSPYDATQLMPSGNFLPLSNNGITSGAPIPPVNSNPQFPQRGGKKGKQSGGGLSDFMSSILPSDVMNIGRSIPAGLGVLADQYNGLTPTASSQVYPTQQPLIQQVTPSATGGPVINAPNVTGAYNSALNTVSLMN